MSGNGNIGLFAGSFDPVTNAHLELLKKASPLFETLYVGIFYNLEKKGMFTLKQRKMFLEESLVDLRNIKVISCSNKLVVDVAKEYGVTHLVRGIRNANDLEYEASLEFFNHQLAPEIETLYFLSSLEKRYLSSSSVRELIHFGQDISDYVPSSVVKEVEK